MIAHGTLHTKAIDQHRVCFDDKCPVAALQGLRTYRTPRRAHFMALRSLTGGLTHPCDAARPPIALRTPLFAAWFVLKSP